MMIYESLYISDHMYITSNSGLSFMPLCLHHGTVFTFFHVHILQKPGEASKKTPRLETSHEMVTTLIKLLMDGKSSDFVIVMLVPPIQSLWYGAGSVSI